MTSGSRQRSQRSLLPRLSWQLDAGKHLLERAEQFRTYNRNSEVDRKDRLDGQLHRSTFDADDKTVSRDILFSILEQGEKICLESQSSNLGNAITAGWVRRCHTEKEKVAERRPVRDSLKRDSAKPQRNEKNA